MHLRSEMVERAVGILVDGMTEAAPGAAEAAQARRQSPSPVRLGAWGPAGIDHEARGANRPGAGSIEELKQAAGRTDRKEKRRLALRSEVEKLASRVGSSPGCPDCVRLKLLWVGTDEPDPSPLPNPCPVCGRIFKPGEVRVLLLRLHPVGRGNHQ